MLSKICARILPHHDLTQLFFVLHQLGKSHVNKLGSQNGKIFLDACSTWKMLHSTSRGAFVMRCWWPYRNSRPSCSFRLYSSLSVLPSTRSSNHEESQLSKPTMPAVGKSCCRMHRDPAKALFKETIWQSDFNKDDPIEWICLKGYFLRDLAIKDPIDC